MVQGAFQVMEMEDVVMSVAVGLLGVSGKSVEVFGFGKMMGDI